MMRITLNGAPKEVAPGTTVAQLMAGEGRAPDVPVAVAVGGEFVPRSTWAERVLAEGEGVEIVAPMQGG